MMIYFLLGYLVKKFHIPKYYYQVFITHSNWRILNDLSMGRIGDILHQTVPLNHFFSSCSCIASLYLSLPHQNDDSLNSQQCVFLSVTCQRHNNAHSIKKDNAVGKKTPNYP